MTLPTFTRWVRLVLLGFAVGCGGVLSAATGPVSIESKAARFTLWPNSGAYEILDRVSGVTWFSNPWRRRFGEVTVAAGGPPRSADLAACAVTLSGPSLSAAFRPLPDREDVQVRVEVRLLKDGRSLEFTCYPSSGADWQSFRLLDDALWINDAEAGGVLVPVREGMLIPSDSGLSFEHRFGTYEYEGCHMEMAGLLKRGSAALLTWHDPYAVLEVRSRTPSEVPSIGRQALSCSLNLRRTARSFTLQMLGPGDQNTIAQAYRTIARQRGWLVTWKEKLRDHPARARLFGAINYKLWSTLDRSMDEASQVEKSARVNWTFEEAAQVAEHLKHDLKLDRVLFTMGGWIRRGYDNQHPDILPAAPECGGDAGLAEASRRIRACGFVFGLHDNYQDIYRDSPSWNEDLIMKKPDGTLVSGGHWAGGRAYLTCSAQALALAQRPQNLRAVLDLTRADAYFIDTTYASGLQECSDPKHPLTRGDDMKYKQALSDYSRSLFGVFGSECGREWAIPHSDFFEGLTGVSGRRFHDAGLQKKLGATMVPLFELVYRDTIAMYGKYGYDIHASAEYVLEHIILGRPLHHHDIPAHLYWTQANEDAAMLPLRLEGAEVTPAGPRSFAIAYRWQVAARSASDWQVFVHFIDASGAIRFQNDHRPAQPVSTWEPGPHREGPLTVPVPAGLNGEFEVRAGLFDPATGTRARLMGQPTSDRAYELGTLTVRDDRVAFEPKATAGSSGAGVEPGLFVQAHSGWAEGLHPVDRFVKNTYEILSPLNELTATVPMTRHEFLTPDRTVVRTVFGEGRDAAEVVVNLGPNEIRRSSRLGGEVILPRYGFLVETPTFITFHARSWNGRRYDSPVLFTLRSSDGRPLSSARRVRVFHGFGDAILRWGSVLQSVPRETELNLERAGP